MFVLLLVAAVIYFILGETSDGVVLLVFVLGVIGIDFYQERKTDKTLRSLRDLSAPRVPVIRDGVETQIASADLVPGDIMLLREGVKVPADGIILRCSDFRADESSLTGEAEGVWKTAYTTSYITSTSDISSDYWRKDYCYAGTLITQGTAAVRVEKIGAQTEYGKIGAGIAAAADGPSPLQKQTGALVKIFAIVAAVLFAVVGVVTWFNLTEHSFGERLTESILSGIALAMAMIPEEFPVILTVFMSLGAWRLAKKNSLTRRLPSVETLGAISVLCVDKTGTITLNQMTVQNVWESGETGALAGLTALACEADAYDPMEQAMLQWCGGQGISQDDLYKNEMVREYAFTNELKMMGHLWRDDEGLRLAVKGSWESVSALCVFTDEEKSKAENKAAELSGEGLRVIAVATANPADDNLPDELTGFSLKLIGLIGLADPPRETVKNDIAICKQAGIRVVMITGDNGATAAAIARKTGMDYGNVVTGAELTAMTDEELRERVKTANIFARVVPEHKMCIVNAFKANGEVVAMTGDGVNDAPALRHADIGIAMGKRGSEVSREAADLILMDDNFSTIIDTVKDGRRIYDNIRKAVGYVFTIHIPIAGASLLAPLLGINPASLLLLPLHVVLLELILDPTCSVVLERAPAERDIMNRPPRDPKEKLMSAGMIVKSILQGVTILTAFFGAYYVTLLQNPDNAPLARAMGMTVIMLANLFLVQVNSSDRDSAVTTIKRLTRDKVMWGVNIITAAGLLVMLYTPLSGFLKVAALSGLQLLIALGLAAASVCWYEVVKLIKRRRQ
jgi:Ca2+-transporting ATPase